MKYHIISLVHVRATCFENSQTYNQIFKARIFSYILVYDIPTFISKI